MNDEAQRAPSASLLVIALIVIGCAVIGLAVIRPMSADATQRAATQAQAAQVEAAERTERERLGQATLQQAAALRAESDARIAGYLGIAGLVVAGALGVMALGGGTVLAMNYLDAQTMRRTLVLLDAQRQARLDASAQLEITCQRVPERIAAQRGDKEGF
jgi:hypothetical protein